MEKYPAASGWPILSLPHGVRVCVECLGAPPHLPDLLFFTPRLKHSSGGHVITASVYQLAISTLPWYWIRKVFKKEQPGRSYRGYICMSHWQPSSSSFVPEYSPFLSMGVKVGPSRKLTEKGLINLKCGVGEKFYRYQRTQDKKSLDQIKPQFKLKRLKWGHRTLIIWWEDESHYKTQ